MADLSKATDGDILQEIKKRYEMGEAECQKLEQELKDKRNALSGYRTMLLAAGMIEKPPTPEGFARGRKPRPEIVAELKELGIEASESEKYSDLVEKLKKAKAEKTEAENGA